MKAIVLYGSTTGNTETVAGWIGEALVAAGTAVKVVNVASAKAALTDCDLVVLGSSTWGEGELQDDFSDYYDNMSADGLSGKRVAVFGCGDSAMFPDYFCEAVDKIEQKARDCGAVIVADSLKIDGYIDDYRDTASEWAAALTQI